MILHPCHLRWMRNYTGWRSNSNFFRFSLIHATLPQHSLKITTDATLWVSTLGTLWTLWTNTLNSQRTLVERTHAPRWLLLSCCQIHLYHHHHHRYHHHNRQVGGIKLLHPSSSCQSQTPLNNFKPTSLPQTWAEWLHGCERINASLSFQNIRLKKNFWWNDVATNKVVDNLCCWPFCSDRVGVTLSMHQGETMMGHHVTRLGRYTCPTSTYSKLFRLFQGEWSWHLLQLLYIICTFMHITLLTKKSRLKFTYSFMTVQCISWWRDFTTSVAWNRNVGHVICFNVMLDVDRLSFLSTHIAYSCSWFPVFADEIFAETHQWFHLFVQFCNVSISRGVV